MKNINLNVISDKSVLSSIKIMNKYMNSFYKLTNVLLLLLLVFGSCGVSFGMDSELLSEKIPQICNKKNKEDEFKIQKEEIKTKKLDLENQQKKLEGQDKVAELEVIKRNVVIQEIRAKLNENSTKENQEDEKLKKESEDLKKRLNELEGLNSKEQLEAKNRKAAIEDIQKQLLGIKIKELEISNEEKKLEIENRKIELGEVCKQLDENYKKNIKEASVQRERKSLESRKEGLEKLNIQAELAINKGNEEIKKIETQLSENFENKPPMIGFQIKDQNSKNENKSTLVDPNIIAVKNMFEDENVLAKINEDIKKDCNEVERQNFIDIKKEDFDIIDDEEIRKIIGDKDISKLDENGIANLLKDVCKFILGKKKTAKKMAELLALQVKKVGYEVLLSGLKKKRR